MSKKEADPLYQLLRSMTPAEKRAFQLQHAGTGPRPPLYVQLFRALDQPERPKDEALAQRIPGLRPVQLSNLKASLYSHLMDTLRMLHRSKDPWIALRDLIDQAQVLYNKGLYRQSLRMLNKAKKEAIRLQDLSIHQEILEFEKLIEARHITRSIENRAELLAQESLINSAQLERMSRLSNLALQMYGLYLKMGHARDESDAVFLRRFFEDRLPNVQLETMSFYEKVNYFQAYSWYSYILQDFLLFYRYTQKWVDLFETYPEQKLIDAALYIKALNNLLNAHFYNLNHRKFTQCLSRLEAFIQQHGNTFSDQTRTLGFVHYYTARINRHFLEGSFPEGLALVPEILAGMKDHLSRMDQHRALVFYYKIACLYFGSGDNNTCILYLNKIIQLRIGNLRADIQCYARILHLIAHYELKHLDLVAYLINSVTHFLEKHKDMSMVMGDIFQFLKQAQELGPREVRPALERLKHTLETRATLPYEQRSYLYLDIVSWLESKIQGLPVQEIIRRKFQHRMLR